MLNLQILTEKQASAGRRDAPVWGKNSTKAEKEFEPDGGVTAIYAEDGDGVVERSAIDDGVIRRVEGGWPLKRDGRRGCKQTVEAAVRRRSQALHRHTVRSDLAFFHTLFRFERKKERRTLSSLCLRYERTCGDYEAGETRSKKESAGNLRRRWNMEGSVGGYKLWASVMKIGGEDRRHTSVRELRRPAAEAPSPPPLCTLYSNINHNNMNINLNGLKRNKDEYEVVFHPLKTSKKNNNNKNKQGGENDNKEGKAGADKGSSRWRHRRLYQGMKSSTVTSSFATMIPWQRIRRGWRDGRQ
ncbi:hypothetical protein PIB30_095074 [Stylosanthes scabra]|uniref:Uncharacterized protein n=1 Tax=Stylosanthes scabra TaxID=79078 RepID=A0ABU6TW84_9FABA|nr:hypothetical protein [Stylosanthes scabra]